MTSAWEQQRRRKTAAIELDFIRAEIALGLTFLDVADTTCISETRIRGWGNALKAHNVALGCMTRHSYETNDEREGVEAFLLILTKRLTILV